MQPLTHRIYLLGQALNRRAEDILRPKFDLGFAEYLALQGVARRRLSSQSELAAFVGVTDAGISRIVSRLAARGLLRAAADPSNRRRTSLTLTAKGSKLAKAASAELERRFVKGADGVATPKDIAAFKRVLDALLTLTEQKR